MAFQSVSELSPVSSSTSCTSGVFSLHSSSQHPLLRLPPRPPPYPPQTPATNAVIKDITPPSSQAHLPHTNLRHTGAPPSINHSLAPPHPPQILHSAATSAETFSAALAPGSAGCTFVHPLVTSPNSFSYLIRRLDGKFVVYPSGGGVIQGCGSGFPWGAARPRVPRGEEPI